ncbi:MAG: hypothetical protein IPL78_13280 [Chloroflexi bacterium]|nr:hypothetical protein [Chloroflexota bacterium]
MLHIHLFGHLRLFIDGRPHKFSALPKATPLLAFLLLHRHSHTPRDTLAYTLWPDVSESESRANLRRHLHELRRNLPPCPGRCSLDCGRITTGAMEPRGRGLGRCGRF